MKIWLEKSVLFHHSLNMKAQPRGQYKAATRFWKRESVVYDASVTSGSRRDRRQLVCGLFLFHPHRMWARHRFDVWPTSPTLVKHRTDAWPGSRRYSGANHLQYWWTIVVIAKFASTRDPSGLPNAWLLLDQRPRCRPNVKQAFPFARTRVRTGASIHTR